MGGEGVVSCRAPQGKSHRFLCNMRSSGTQNRSGALGELLSLLLFQVSNHDTLDTRPVA